MAATASAPRMDLTRAEGTAATSLRGRLSLRYGYAAVSTPVRPGPSVRLATLGTRTERTREAPLVSPNKIACSGVTAVTPVKARRRHIWYHNPCFDRHTTTRRVIEAASPRSILYDRH